MSVELKMELIGVIETPLRERTGTRIQPLRANGARAKVRIEPRLEAGLQDHAGFERIWLIHRLHRTPVASLVPTAYLDQRQRGVFAARASARPSPIGISAVRLQALQEGVIEVADAGMIESTPLQDIKPYVPDFNCYPASKAGWLDESNSKRGLSDYRIDGTSPGKGAEQR